MTYHYTDFLNTTVPALTSIKQCPNLPDGYCHVVVDGIRSICRGHYNCACYYCFPVDKPWYYDLITYRPDWFVGAICLAALAMFVVAVTCAWWMGIHVETPKKIDPVSPPPGNKKGGRKK